MNKEEIEIIRKKIEDNHIPVPESGCWLWTGHTARGYGCFQYGGRKNHVQWRAARASYTLYKGPIPEGLHVLHKCDTPLCINPDHLWIGTAKDNMRDKASKGRQNRGITSPLSKLSEDEVRAIKRLYKPYDRNYNTHSLAKLFKVGQMTIHRIISGVSWSHLT